MRTVIQSIAAAVVLALLAFTTAGAAEHHSHGHEGAAAKLTLDNGKKWPTDEPLRTAMGHIREAMAASLPDIHAGKLGKEGYRSLAGKLNGEVANIVANCKLEPKADAQLHLVIADLLAGADAMEGKAKGVKPASGAVRVVAALDHYATYFEDAGFTRLQH
jgi:hypothetical protein